MTPPDSLRVRLGPGREFDLIRRVAGGGAGERPPPVRLDEGLRSRVRLGPGDDAALLDLPDGVVTLDLSVEGVHFRREWLEPEEIGSRAARAALSDLAAMAAQPVCALVSVAFPAAEAESVGLPLLEGVRDTCERFGAEVVGGDLSRSPGPIVVDVVAIGATEHPLSRAGARPGDEVWVTGRLGAAAAALTLWEAGETPPPELRAAFASPVPRIEEVLWLRDRAPLRAGIDLSDGLVGDAGHLAAASGVTIELDAQRIPIWTAAAPAGGSLSRDSAPPGHDPDDVGLAPPTPLDLALGGGEDYELCLVAPAGALEPLATEFTERFGILLTLVGRVLEGGGKSDRGPEGGVIVTGAPVRPEGHGATGYDHFGDVDARGREG